MTFRPSPGSPLVSQEFGSFKGSGSSASITFLVECATDYLDAINAVMYTILGDGA